MNKEETAKQKTILLRYISKLITIKWLQYRKINCKLCLKV